MKTSLLMAKSRLTRNCYIRNSYRTGRWNQREIESIDKRIICVI